MDAIKYIFILNIAFVLSRESPQYGVFIVPHGTGLYCTIGLSLGWLTEPDTSLHTCAIACTSHENCSGFHLLSNGMSCELMQGFCTDVADMEQNATVVYYHGQALCPRTWVKVFDNGTNVISNACSVAWSMTGTVSECIQRSCEGGVNGISFYMPDGTCIARSCSPQGLSINPLNQYSEYEVYAPIGHTNVTFI